ncbi:MAG: DUF4097 family beta strand repeat protein [Candidatus Aminicenantes bacterium]|nr:DUF4097 family beta strand repeat protein [Candidatus Aminicenantes bacterium]
MKKFQKTTILMVIILSLVFLNLHSGEKKEVNKTFKALENVKIKVVSGDCVIKKGKKSEIKVHLVYTFSDEKYKPVMEVEGDTLVLKEEFTKSRSNDKGHSSWTVTVPEKTNIEAKTASGDISASGLKSEFYGKAASGDIKVSDFAGKLTVKVASGDVEVKKARGKMRLEVASGDIEVDDAAGVFEVKCASGGVDLTGVVIEGASEFKVVSGDTNIKLAKTCAYNLELTGVSGNIVLDYNGNALKGYYKFNGPKGGIKTPFSFDKKEESRYSPFVKRSQKVGGDSPVISMKTVSGDLILKK